MHGHLNVKLDEGVRSFETIVTPSAAQNKNLISIQSHDSNDTTRSSYASKEERNKLHYLPEFVQLYRIDEVLVFGLRSQFWRKRCRMHGSRASCCQLGTGAALVRVSLSGTASEARQLF